MDLRKFARAVVPLVILAVAACSDPTGTPPNPEGEGKTPPTDDTESIVPADSLDTVQIVY